jgi:CubicO group peptidase (beta-lactamase class C family)
MVRTSLLFALSLIIAPALSAAEPANPYAATDRIFEEYTLDAHVPGLVYGVVSDGKLAHTGTFGVQDLESKRPVTADTLFRIASMTKAFTALTVLKLRDDGRIRLDAPAETYVPEMRGWKYPTEESPRILVRDLMSHVGGFVTDDPWGDRQTPLAEDDFTRMLREGVPFTRAPGTAFEYSNLGYALLGRIVTNVSKHNFAETITQTLLKPLGMDSSGFIATAAPAERRALGYRWEDDAWKPEPLLGPGAFGAMGGLQTSANDYSKWLAFLLSAWPARDGADSGPVKRATVRELSEGLNFPTLRARPARSGTAPAQQAVAYAKGFIVMVDPELGFTMIHGGGYPGYGSYVMLMPNRGVAIFVLTNRTYAGPSAPAWEAVLSLVKAGALPDERTRPVSSELSTAYRAAVDIYKSGSIEHNPDALAMNFVLDRSAAAWERELTKLKAQVGECDTSAPITATGNLAGNFNWRCSHGRVRGGLLLAPTHPPQIQSLSLTVVQP